MREAAKLGFTAALSGSIRGDLGTEAEALSHKELSHIRDLVAGFAIPDED